jgi:Zn-dependent peptidase ImmA (M78 family)/DNA-binding transcriptional regulator YiaG
MTSKFTTNSVPHVALKLREARKATRLSTRAVSDRLGDRLAISHATIANYEKGRSAPTLDVLAILATIYERPVNWFLEPGATLVGIRYRNLRSKVRVSDRHWFEANAQRWLEAYVKLENRLNKPIRAPATFFFQESQQPEYIAQQMRRHLKLRLDDPIPSVVRSLENLGIRVIELPTDLAINGLAARFGECFVVVLNPNVSNDRCRMDAAHELGHIANGDCSDNRQPNPESEARAFNIGSHFLLPQRQLEDAFKGRSLVRMVQYKERFGISLAAMVYRAEHCGILSPQVARKLWIEFSERGWRKKEPGYVRPDRAVRFEDLLDSAIQENRITWREAESVTGIREEELKSRLKLAMGIPKIEQAEEGGDIPPQILKLVS